MGSRYVDVRMCVYVPVRGCVCACTRLRSAYVLASFTVNASVSIATTAVRSNFQIVSAIADTLQCGVMVRPRSITASETKTPRKRANWSSWVEYTAHLCATLGLDAVWDSDDPLQEMGSQ